MIAFLLYQEKNYKQINKNMIPKKNRFENNIIDIDKQINKNMIPKQKLFENNNISIKTFEFYCS